jgi:hypothetical protein
LIKVPALSPDCSSASSAPGVATICPKGNRAILTKSPEIRPTWLSPGIAESAPTA